MVFITEFIQLTVIVVFFGIATCYRDTATSLQVIGRNTSSSECDKFYLIPGNNTFNLSSDGYQIDPPCSLYFLGFGKADKKTGFTGMCYDVVDVDIRCGYGNTFTVRSWSLVENQNGNDSYLIVNNTVPSLEHNFTCHDNGTLLDNNPVCLENISMFEISVHIVTEDKRPSTIAFRTSVITDEIYQEVDLRNNILIVPDNCECDSDNCTNCHLQTHKVSTHLVKRYGDRRIPWPEIDLGGNPPVVDDGFDLNNLITVIGSLTGTLLVPVVVALVRKYIYNKGEEKDDDTELKNLDAEKDDNTELKNPNIEKGNRVIQIWKSTVNK